MAATEAVFCAAFDPVAVLLVGDAVFLPAAAEGAGGGVTTAFLTLAGRLALTAPFFSVFRTVFGADSLAFDFTIDK